MIKIFFSYQVVEENIYLCFGQGVLMVDVKYKALNFDSCCEEIKKHASAQREADGFDPVDWNYWKLHIIAFNQMPG